MKEKKTVPELRFPGFVESWNFFKLKEFTILITKGTTPRIFKEGTVTFVKIESLNGTFIDINRCANISSEIHNNELKRSMLVENDILFAIAGATIGKVGLVNKNIIPANTNQALAIIRLKNQENKEILVHLLQSRIMKKYISLNISVGAQPNLNLEQMGNFSFSLPSLPEQKKIAAFLSDIDRKIELISRKKELMEQYKKGMMQKLFSRELRFKDDDGGEFPDWEIIRGKDLFLNISNKNHTGDLPILSASQEKGMVLRDENGIDIKSSVDSVMSYKIVEKGDFVISLRSFQGGIEYSELLGICSPAYIILKPKKKIKNQFYKFYFKKEDFIERLSKTVVGIRDGKQISYDAFGGLKLLAPCYKEQEKIAIYLSTLEKKIESLTRQKDQIETFKKGLLKKMFV